ncbi:hypothetical protein OPQ81_000012 [Rhizoctonia solani]|nr:hypothetical protein OPQ81_000012 [Rhizoctonia solani]
MRIARKMVPGTSWVARGWDKEVARKAIGGLVSQAARMGIHMDHNPPITFAAAQALDVAKHLRSAGHQVIQRYRIPSPALLVVVLPAYSSDLYQAVKHFGDITVGVATQCLKGPIARAANEQYWANVCLKINAKLGGVNSRLNPLDIPRWIFDPTCPTMIIGSHLSGPSPGTSGRRPSFAAVVGSLDSNAVHYAATNSVQSSSIITINEFENMVYELISRHALWKKNREKQTEIFPERIIYYHGGISDSEISRVLNTELVAIQAACRRHKINPKITIVIVVPGDGNHVRFFPTHGMADSSGNCPAGTVVDSVVGNPQEFDFYLQSHSSPMGTSCPSYYRVIHDENKFNQDSIQGLTYALCHLNARSTRSTSIPVPLHYAKLVSARARNHYDPSFLPRYGWGRQFAATGTGKSDKRSLRNWLQAGA